MGLENRIRKLEDAARPTPEDEREREGRRNNIREQAEHANRCGWERHGEPLFEIDEDDDVFCDYDGRPVTDSRQILAEQFYFMEVRDGGPGLIHDDGEHAYYALTGELAVSRDRVDSGTCWAPRGAPLTRRANQPGVWFLLSPDPTTSGRGPYVDASAA
jgi:hypothetical protein